jgi:hypothetical protein
LVIGVLSALPVINIANCCCAWILFGGGLAAYLMQQNDPEPITAGDGAVVGLLAGVAGACIWLILTIPISAAIAPFQNQLMQRALRNATDMAPEARAFLERMAAGGPPTGLGLIFSFFVMLCISSVFGMFGGLFGALMFRKSAPPPPPPPLPPPYFPGSTPDGFSPPPLPGEERR